MAQFGVVAPGLVVTELVVAACFAAMAYGVASSRLRRFGYAPWRWHPILWAVICFVIGIFGLILLLIAVLTTRYPRQFTPMGFGSGTTGSGPYGVGPDRFGSAPASPAATSVPTGAVPEMAPPGWYPDPGGRHQLRYWKGDGWSEFVSDGGFTSIDYS